MSQWQIVDQPDLDRVVISNSDLGCEVYFPHWSQAQVAITHSPPESGINAELLSCHFTGTCAYTLTHATGTDAMTASEYLLEVWADNCLVTKVPLPFAFGEKLQQKWLQKKREH